MKILPIAERELRVASRRGSSYWTRFVAAGGAVIAGALFLMAAGVNSFLLQDGRNLFTILASLSFIYCLVSGPVNTSDCVSEEKRDGTLGLLFLTTLRGYDVVLGKFIAFSVLAIIAVVASLPMIGLPLMLGGIPAGALGATAAVLTNTLFLSLSVGVFVSVLARDSRRAASAALLIMFTLLIAGPFILLLTEMYAGPIRRHGLTWPFELLLLPSPGYAFFEALNGMTRPRAWSAALARAMILQHALAWAALGAACVAIPRSWQERVAPQLSDTRRGRAAARRHRKREALRAAWLDKLPFAWAVLRNQRGRLVTWIGLLVIAALWLWGFLEMGHEWLEPWIGIVLFFTAALWLKLRVAAVACRDLHEQRRSGALEILLCTPQSTEAVIKGNMAALRHLFLPPTLVVMAVSIAMAVFTMPGTPDFAELLVTQVALWIVFLADLWAIAWTGMRRGLLCRRYIRARLETAGWVLGFPWIVFFGGTIGMSVISATAHLRFNPGYNTVAILWLSLCVGVDAILILTARSELPKELRSTGEEGGAPSGVLIEPATPRAGASPKPLTRETASNS